MKEQGIGKFQCLHFQPQIDKVTVFINKIQYQNLDTCSKRI